MPTILAHAAVGWALGRVLTRGMEPRLERRVPDVAALLAILPDADVLGFRLGVHYGDLLGHRGLSHSVLFAFVVSGLALAGFRSAKGRVALALFLAAVSHPLLDMLTDGGLGVALWAPLSNERYFFPWTPIPVSPIGIGPGLARVLGYELVIFGPLALLAWIFTRRRPA